VGSVSVKARSLRAGENGVCCGGRIDIGVLAKMGSVPFVNIELFEQVRG
jgi:hypothetical protein